MATRQKQVRTEQKVQGNQGNQGNQKVQVDRGICKFFILGKCTRGEECKWVHTKNQCTSPDCETYTERDNCYKCYKVVRETKKAAYEKRLKEDGKPCSNETCKDYTLRGDYCNNCFEDAKQYVLGPCRNRQCNRRVMGGRGFCGYCDGK